LTASIKANVDGSAAIQVGGSDVITLTSGGAATFLTSPTTVQAGTAAAPSITFSGDTNTGIYSPGADTIAFTEGGVESMRIDSAGNMGLGTSSPFSTAGSTVLTVGGSSSSTSGRLFLRDASNNNQIQVYISSTFNEFNSQSELNVRTEAGALRFTTANTERARFNDTGAFVLAGGTTTANGIGITFPATQSASSNANTLDDYEEGTFSPSLDGYSAINMTVRQGVYVKIGKTVYVRGKITWTSRTVSANVYVSNLPFNRSQTTFDNSAQALHVQEANGTTRTWLLPYTTTNNWYAVTDGSGVPSTDPYGASGTIIFSGTYDTDS